MEEDFNLEKCITTLRNKREIFHSEADFQFALAWEIQLAYPEAVVHLEYCPKAMPNMHIDIVVFLGSKSYPIELKYKTARLDLDIGSEAYALKAHYGQDLGKYDCLLDIQRIESMRDLMQGFAKGYAVWLTNDLLYLKTPSKSNAFYREFSVHEGSEKSGLMSWDEKTGEGTIKGRAEPIVLCGNYAINWKPYSTVEAKRNGAFYYALIEVNK
ncbi:MAG: hypothetical protein ABFD03_01945 [Clostridiaceae bacterium]